jgi:hypothetical protein
MIPNMKKKSLGILIALAFIGSSFSVPAFANVKAGATCKKVGVTSTALGKTHTCIKSGKKLIWNKGVSKSSVNVPISVPVDIPISLDNLDVKGVPQKAYSNVIKVLNSRPRASFEPTKFIGANVAQARVNEEIAGLERAIDLWAPYFQPKKFQVVYVVAGDDDWLEKKSAELGLGSMVPPGQTWSMRMKMFLPCGFAMAGIANNVPTFVQCLSRPFSGGVRQTGAHEYTHLFQLSYGGPNGYKIPWYLEGSASYFGWTLGFHPLDPNLAERKSWVNSQYLNMSAESRSPFQSKDLQRFKSVMKSLTHGTDQSIASTSYWAGGLATEVLVALYGFDKFVEFTKNIQTSSDMSSLLKQTYGFDEDYFYEKLAPYVWAQIP